MVWVAAIPHWLGGSDGSPMPRPVRRVTPARGFFVARRPLDRDALAACGFRPRRDAVLAPALAQRLAITPDPPVALARDDAEGACSALARASGAAVELPTADELEMAARGPDARRYSWGNGLERLDGTERSPWGIERFAVPIAQWTTSRDASGHPLAVGGPTAPACAARLALDDGAGCAARPVVRE
jgi:formylglycine-generating enzyme required for sulfatase activity